MLIFIKHTIYSTFYQMVNLIIKELNTLGIRNTIYTINFRFNLSDTN